MKSIASLSIVIALASVCASNEGRNKKATNPVNELSFQILSQLNGERQNVVYSPLGIAMALGMALKGARGATAEEIIRGLKLTPGSDVSKLHLKLTKIAASSQVENRPNLTLEFGNLAAVAQDFPVNPEYSKYLQNEYKALVKTGDFAQNGLQVTNEINDFVKEKTHGLISKIFDRNLDQRTKLILMNTIYFKGVFENKFREKGTRKETFYNSDKTESKVDTMVQESKLKSSSDDDLTLIQLPYVGSASMYVVVPKERYGLQSVLSKLSLSKLESLIESLSSSKYQLSFPKLKYSFKPNLKKILEGLGMKKMFTSEANFTGISNKTNLYLDEAVHKATILVNEGGTEAAGATGFSFRPIRPAPPEPVTVLKVDHPFAYIIRDQLYNMDLFIGVVNTL